MNDGGGDLLERVPGVHQEGQLHEAFLFQVKEGPATGKPAHDNAGNVVLQAAKTAGRIGRDQVKRSGKAIEHVPAIDISPGIDDPHRYAVDRTAHFVAAIA
jgi:hypothetical protein